MHGHLSTNPGKHSNTSMDPIWLVNFLMPIHAYSLHKKIKIQNSWTLPHQWQHDCHIMDDIAMLSITPLEMQCINNVCLFLQINMLSVWNHGSHWLLTTTNSIWCSRHQQWFEVWVRFHPSMALLIVPWLDCLEKWQAVLCQLNLHTNLLKLCTPLGPWYKDGAHVDWQWKWWLCPQTNLQYGLQTKKWYIYTLLTKCQTYAKYDPFLMEPPKSSCPVTTTLLEYQHKLIQISFPIMDYMKTAPPTNHTPRHYLLTSLITPDQTWSMHLWEAIHPLQLLNMLQLDLARGIPFLIVSDAAMTIHSTHTLWQGEGAIPGPEEDAHSTQSEAFGILTALQFLCQYLSHIPINIYRSASGYLRLIHIWCTI